MAMTSRTLMLPIAVAMMVAMMLPSFAATLLTYYRHLHGGGNAAASQRTTAFAVGYVGVWSTISLLLVASPASHVGQPAPWVVSIVILCVGAIQCSRWKARRLARCRPARVSALSRPSTAIMACLQGARFGVDCALSCAGPMAVLWVVGLMDIPMMLIITAAITAERVAPAGVRVARFTGLVALTVGLL